LRTRRDELVGALALTPDHIFRRCFYFHRRFDFGDYSRPRAFLGNTFGAEFSGDNSLKAVIKEVHYFGATTRVILDANGLKLEAVLLRLANLKIGDVCSVSLPPNRISVLKD